EIAPTAPALPASMQSDGIEGVLQHLSCSRVRMGAPFDLWDRRAYDSARQHQFVPMGPSLPSEIICGEQIRKQPTMGERFLRFDVGLVLPGFCSPDCASKGDEMFEVHFGKATVRIWPISVRRSSRSNPLKLFCRWTGSRTQNDFR